MNAGKENELFLPVNSLDCEDVELLKKMFATKYLTFGSRCESNLQGALFSLLLPLIYLAAALNWKWRFLPAVIVFKFIQTLQKDV